MSPLPPPAAPAEPAGVHGTSAPVEPAGAPGTSAPVEPTGVQGTSAPVEPAGAQGTSAPPHGQAPRVRLGRVVPAGTTVKATDIRPGFPQDPVADAVHQVSVWNIANALTVLRLLLVPVFVVFLFVDQGDSSSWRIAAWGVYAGASITDRFDGQVARARNLVTDFGKIADPIADKALNGAALIGLSVLGQLAWWVTVVILAREIGVTLLRFWVIKRGVIPASKGGKLKTLLQTVALSLYILPLTGWLATARAYVMGVAVLVTVVTGLDYVQRAIRLRRRTTSARAS